MTEEQAGTGTVDAILEEAIPFTVKVNNVRFLHRIHFLPKARKYSIRPLTLGTLLRISKILVTIPKPTEKNFGANDMMSSTIETIFTCKDKMIDIIALAITNSTSLPRVCLKRFLSNNLTPSEAFAIMQVVTKQMDVLGFMSSIILVKGMSLLKTEGKIASGDQLVV